MTSLLLAISYQLSANFGAAEGPHIAIAPEELFKIGQFSITNSIFYGAIAACAVAFILIKAARKISIKANNGPAQLVEVGTEFVISLLEGARITGKKAYKYAPFFASIFFFVLLNNWFGLLPGVGPAIEINGAPAFRPFTADWNGTLAMALVAIISVQYFAIKEKGGKKHFLHYFGGNLKNPINIFVGILEMFGELTRVASLSLRLFFNILIGEILISIFTYIGGSAAPITTLVFIIMELAVGLIQAYIFTMLCVTYLSIAITHSEEHHEEPEPQKTQQLGVDTNQG